MKERKILDRRFSKENKSRSGDKINKIYSLVSKSGLLCKTSAVWFFPSESARLHVFELILCVVGRSTLSCARCQECGGIPSSAYLSGNKLPPNFFFLRGSCLFLRRHTSFRLYKKKNTKRVWHVRQQRTLSTFPSLARVNPGRKHTDSVTALFSAPWLKRVLSPSVRLIFFFFSQVFRVSLLKNERTYHLQELCRLTCLKVDARVSI